MQSVGSRYQCTDIPGEEPDPTIKRGPAPKKKRSKKKESEEVAEPERGVDEASEIIWRPDASTSYADLDFVMDGVKAKSVANKQGNVDLIVDALKVLYISAGAGGGYVKVSDLCQNPPYHASLAPWLEEESQLFDQDLEEHEDELGRYDRTRQVKTVPEIVHHYYREKGYQKRFMHLEDPAQDKFAAAGPQGIEAEHGELLIVEEDEDGDSSVVEDPPASDGSRARHQCAVCSTEKADVWYRCPEGLGALEATGKDRYLCPSCSTQWRRCKCINPYITQVLRLNYCHRRWQSESSRDGS